MATDAEFVQYVVDQAAGAGAITHRKMFGEYALYVDGKVVALVCDNKLFVKPTAEGRAFVGGGAAEAAPYSGAKPHLLVENGLDDGDWLGELLRTTARALPAPKPKRKRRG